MPLAFVEERYKCSMSLCFLVWHSVPMPLVILRDRYSDRERERVGARERERECVCVCEGVT